MQQLVSGAIMLPYWQQQQQQGYPSCDRLRVCLLCPTVGPHATLGHAAAMQCIAADLSLGSSRSCFPAGRRWSHQSNLHHTSSPSTADAPAPAPRPRPPNPSYSINSLACSGDLAESNGGHVLINSRLRKVLAGVQSGSIYHHPPHHIEPSRLPIPDLPSGSLVLALNLCCYWLLTKQANRLR